MGRYVRAAWVGDLEPAHGKFVEVEGKRIALFNVGGVYYAVDANCTHRGGPLSEGELNGYELTCPWHGSVFNVATGAVVQGPATENATTYPVRVVGSDIEIEVEGEQVRDRLGDLRPSLTPEGAYTYVIVGGGLAGAYAIQGIRERDKNGSVLLIGQEKQLPYDRPPLSKDLWFGKKKVDQIFTHDRAFYDQNGVTLALGTKVLALDAIHKTIATDTGRTHHYEKLLLATGGIPRSLPIPGGNLPGICYFRYLDDYLRIRGDAIEGKSATVIGGGFIGSEIAAALSINKVQVTMVFPSPYLLGRVFPDYLGRAIQRRYMEGGIKIMAGERPASLAREGNWFLTRTEGGKQIKSDLLIVGVGIAPAVALAERTGLQIDNGVVVNEFLQTSHPEIFAAGDNAFFPSPALGQHIRIEHWDNAVTQGKWAGQNMTGEPEPFTYLPYFFSDLFEFGFEAVGDTNAELETFADWQKENDTGVVYYLKEGKIRGVMLCKVWGKIDAARELIQKGDRVTRGSLRGAIR